MSEQTTSYMAELDLWSDANVVGPLFTAARDYDEQDGNDWEDTVARVQKAIRAKVLESYRNGRTAGPQRAKEPRKGFRP